MPDSISRQHSRWAANLSYEDLPLAVIDKIKAILLMHLLGGIMGIQNPQARELAELFKKEEPRANGATIFGDSTKVSRNAASMINCEIMHAAGLYDSFRMITHPGPVLVAVALANAQINKKSMKNVITALAAGYEFECRLADDYVPTISAHGFRPAPILSTMGAAVVAGKLFELDEDGFQAAIAIAANAASGLNETARSGGSERKIHEPNSARQGTYAALMASMGHIRGSESIIEGDAGFYNGYAGSRDGALSYVFTGPRQKDLATITENLGTDYRLLHVMFRMYTTAGFNQPVIDLIAQLTTERNIAADDIEELLILMNYLETLYPSPEFPRVADPSVAYVGSTQYFAAHSALYGGYPVVGGRSFGEEGDPALDQRVLNFMRERVRLVGVHDMPMFSPRVNIKLKDGSCHEGNYPYEKMEWNYDQLVNRLQDCVPGLEGGQDRFDMLVAIVRDVEQISSIPDLLSTVGL